MAFGVAAKYRSAWRSRDLRTLIVAFLIDGGTGWSYTTVLVAYIYGRTHSATWVSGLLTIGWVVGMLCGPYAGVLADRYDRRLVLTVSAFGSMAVTLVLAALVQADAPLAAILAVAGAVRAVWTPTRPASGALIPEVVAESELIAANSIFALLESLIVVIGPGVGALLLLTGKPVSAVLLNAAGFLVSGLLYLRLTVRSKGSAEPGGNLVKQWTAGVSALVKHRAAFVLTAFLLLDSGAINAANALLPALSAHLHGGRTGYSLLLGANALGGVAIAVLANKLASSPRVAMIITASIVLECVPIWICVFVGDIGPGIVLQLISGAGMVVVDVLAFTALQRDLPRDVLGRVLGSVDVLLLGISIISAFAGSELLAHVGIGWALGLIGLGFPAISLLGIPVLLRLDAETAANVTALRVRTTVLEKLDLFAGAPQALLERLAKNAEPEAVSAGTTLIRQGDDADALWVLTAGELSVGAVLDGGGHVDLPPVAAPGYVGELGLLHHRPRTATVVTATDCELLKISGAEFESALEQAAPSAIMLGRAGVRLARTSPRASGVKLMA